MKIQKLKIFVLPKQPKEGCKQPKGGYKQEVLEEIGNFLPLNIENKIVFYPYKTRSFEGIRRILR